jgi:hypothetical protein
VIAAYTCHDFWCDDGVPDPDVAPGECVCCDAGYRPLYLVHDDTTGAVQVLSAEALDRLTYIKDFADGVTAFAEFAESEYGRLSAPGVWLARELGLINEWELTFLGDIADRCLLTPRQRKVEIGLRDRLAHHLRLHGLPVVPRESKN